ncbi:NUDIX hydrolase [Phaeovulum sp. NW3]|uniref:NUDIX hydrolase n=1 Tax=Phaeovulum sp. NW3 TaxID=2934933 RepID=UPI0024C36A86|nr:NUDIX hydrolase [Phaeovulum sp. NW3]
MGWLRSFLTGLFGRRPPHLQVAAICMRKRKGRREVLLISSLGTGRWIVPKGWPMRGRSLAGAALQEAWEEAGIRGRVGAAPIGSYVYEKMQEGGLALRIEVLAFPVEIETQAEHYPEAGRRERMWMPAAQAAEKVAEPGLRKILRDLATDSEVVAQTESR